MVESKLWLNVRIRYVRLDFFFLLLLWNLKKAFPHQRSVRFKFPCQPTGRGKYLCVCACTRVACARARSVRVAYIILLCGMLVCARGRERTAVLRNDFRLLINCVKNEKNINHKNTNVTESLFFQNTSISVLNPACWSSTSFPTRKTIILCPRIIITTYSGPLVSMLTEWAKKKKIPLLVIITHTCIV